jgi:hypothetical protein
MGFAALISWLVTALFGLFLLTIWLIENDVLHGDATAASPMMGAWSGPSPAR